MWHAIAKHHGRQVPSALAVWDRPDSSRSVRVPHPKPFQVTLGISVPPTSGIVCGSASVPAIRDSNMGNRFSNMGNASRCRAVKYGRRCIRQANVETTGERYVLHAGEIGRVNPSGSTPRSRSSTIEHCARHFKCISRASPLGATVDHKCCEACSDSCTRQWGLIITETTLRFRRSNAHNR
jgi:hypothetical protein